MARSTDQVVEVIPLMDGEDSPRRVLCPYALVGRNGFSRASCTPLLRAGGRSLSVRDRAREGLVMSCAENGGSIPTNGGAVSRRVREEASQRRAIRTVFLVAGSRGRIPSVWRPAPRGRARGAAGGSIQAGDGALVSQMIKLDTLTAPVAALTTQVRGTASDTSSWAVARHSWLSMATGRVDGLRSRI